METDEQGGRQARRLRLVGACAALTLLLFASALVTRPQWWPRLFPAATPAALTQVTSGATLPATPASATAPATSLPAATVPTDTPPPASLLPATPTPKVTPTPKAGATRTRSKDGMAMVYVPAGEFTMGSPDGEGGSDEHPQHDVSLDAYWIDRTEVTNDQYRKCVKAGACAQPGCWGEGNYNGGSQPVVCVSWEGAKAYCAWAGARLPTEAEWEKAARGTDGRRYPWGNEEPDCARANYGGCVGKPNAVGSYASGASPYGALDMAGNVWEWVGDWYDAGYYGVSPARNPQGPDSWQFRVLRGGSWHLVSGYVRSTYRFGSYPGYLYYNIGFRCGVSSTSSP